MNKACCNNSPNLKFFYCLTRSINLLLLFFFFLVKYQKKKKGRGDPVNINWREKPRKEINSAASPENHTIEVRHSRPPLFYHISAGGAILLLCSGGKEHYYYCFFFFFFFIVNENWGGKKKKRNLFIWMKIRII